METQLEVCRLYARRRGYVVIKEVAEDVSGANLVGRKGLDEIRDLAESGEIGTVIIYHVDRFARDASDALFVYKELKKLGVSLQSATVPIEDTPTGKLMFTILAGIAELERATIIDRTRRGKERRAREGRPVRTSMEPYGYRYVGIDAAQAAAGQSAFEIVEGEAEVVRQIYRWLVEDKLSIHAIAMRLLEEGVPTKRGGYWGPGTLHRILRNELYAGQAHWNKTYRTKPKRPQRIGGTMGHDKSAVRYKPKEEWIPYRVPAIIDREMFERAAVQLASNSYNSIKNRKRFYMLAGLIRCVRCGGRYYGVSKEGGYRYYRCGMRAKPNYKVVERRCDNETYRAEYLEGRVWEAIGDYITAPERTQQRPAGKLTPAEEAARRDEREMARLERLEESLVREEKRLLEAYRTGVIDLEQLRETNPALLARKRENLEARARLKERILDRRRIDHDEKDLEERRLLMRVGLDAITDEGKRQLLQMMEIIVHLDGDEAELAGLLLHRIVLKL